METATRHCAGRAGHGGRPARMPPLSIGTPTPSIGLPLPEVVAPLPPLGLPQAATHPTSAQPPPRVTQPIYRGGRRGPSHSGAQYPIDGVGSVVPPIAEPGPTQETEPVQYVQAAELHR